MDELCTFKEISNVIVNLHITLPKPGIFSPDVNFIMIIATVSEIFIVLIIKNQDGKLNFIKSDFMYDITDNVITSICSSSERRVFLGSQNNYLYELDYSHQKSFFGYSKKIKTITHTSQSFFEKIIPNFLNLKKHSYINKMVVDNSRHLLYALIYYTKSDQNIFDTNLIYDSQVNIYDLGEDGKVLLKSVKLLKQT